MNRVAERRIDERPARRRWPVYLALALVGVLMAAGVYVVYFTSVLALRTVSVVGADQSVEQQVRDELADQLGRPLAGLDTDGVQRTLDAIPEIESASVQRHWPHGVDVVISQRRAVAVTKANDAWWSLDATGVPFSPVRARPARLMLLELATPGADDAATHAALQVLAALPADIRTLTSSIRAASPYRIELLLADKRTVIWGDASASAQKAKVLPLMLQQRGTVFDLSDPTMVSVK